jgi:DNA polymerase I - 3'-5' exonuclease and polymerase domains
VWTSNPETRTARAVAGFDVDAALGLDTAPAPSPLAQIERHYEIITEWDQLERWLDRLRTAELIAFDTETTSLDYMRAQIVGVPSPSSRASPPTCR